jgi:transcriptional regulator with GAF, ATPase, and Fis domain
MKIENDPSNLKSDALIDFSEILGQQNEFEEILRLITRKTSDLIQTHMTLIMMINPRTLQTMKTVFSTADKTDARTYHTLHTSISGWVIKNELPLISQDINSDSRFRQRVFKDVPVKSVLCVPLRCENVVFGTLSLFRDMNTAEFHDADLLYLQKIAAIVAPFARNVQKIEHYFKPQIPTETILRKYEVHGMLGKSKRFLELLHAVDAAARSDVRVLLEGKSGTGKELIARAIHHCSERSPHKFVAVDCGAIPEHLIESELFGHIKGAFTGATMDRKGLLEEADNGTLFMDEITNLPMDMQVKLLRVLQEGEIRPLGSNASRKVNVRIITAASMPLKELVNTNQFREDLFYRLLVFPIHVPSLEDRQEDIPLLANHFVKKYSEEQKKQVRNFDEGVLELIKHHFWTGNIRELENFVERMITLAPSDQIQIDTGLLPSEFRNELKNVKINKKKIQKSRSLNETLSEHEMQIVQQTLIDYNWNQSSAAKALGIDESTLRYKIKKLGIKRRV